MAIIYKCTNLKNGKSYIGKTIYSLEERMKSHYNNLNFLQTYFSRAIKKYGKDSFIWEVVEECTNKELNEREIYYISFLNTKIPNGYNMTDGGDGAAVGELNVSKRRDVRDKLKEKSSKFRHSKETKKLLSELAKDQFKNGMPQETKQKIRNSCEGHYANKGEKNKLSKTYHFLNPNGEKIKVIGIREFCRQNNLDHSAMVAVSKSKLKQHKGYKLFCGGINDDSSS